MNKVSTIFFFLIAFCIGSSVCAQEAEIPKPVPSTKGITDSIQSAVKKLPGKFIDSSALKNATKLPVIQKPSADSIKSKLVKQAQLYKSSLENKLKAPSDSAIKEKLAAYASAKLKAGNLPGLKSKGDSDKQSEKGFNLSIENGTMYLSESPLKNGPGLLNNFSVAGKFTIAKIPVNLDLSNNYSTDRGFEPLQSNLFKFNFDREGMLNSMRSDVERFTDFKSTFLKGIDLPDFTANAVIAKLRSMPEAKALTSSPTFVSALKAPGKVNELLSLNGQQLREKVADLVSISKQEIAEQGKSKLDESKEKLTAKSATAVDSIEGLKAIKEKESLIKNLSSTAGQQKLKANLTDSITSVISKIRNRLAENGLDAGKIQLIQKFIAGNGSIDDLGSEVINELSKNPANTKLQSAFTRLRSFQTGAFAGQLPGSALNKDVFAKGLSLSVKTQQGPVSLGFGKQNDVSTAKDAAFENSVYASPRFYSYLSVPTNKSSFGSGKLSWIGSFSTQDDKNQFQSATAIGRNSMVFTVTQTLDIQKMGKLTMDISKSASKYNNTLAPGSDQLMLDKSVLSNYFSDDLFETTSIGLNHDLESKRMNLTSNVYFNYAGVGFQNPGAAGGTNMKMRLGGNLKKKLFDNRLAVSLRTDLRNTPVSFSSDAHWQNLQVQFDSRFRLNKSINFNAKYLQNGMNKVGGVNTPVYSSRKFQLGGNANYKIAGKYSFSNITLAQQQVANSQILSSNSNFITMNYLQSLVLNNSSITANIFYNKETSAVKLMGDMLNGDFAYQYSLLKMNITSSVTYLDNKDVARQVGIKQNFQLLAGKHFDINAYADLRKNLIQPLYPDLYAAGRGEISIKYYLKNKF